MTPASHVGQGSALIVPDPIAKASNVPPPLPGDGGAGASPDINSPRLSSPSNNPTPVNLPSSLTEASKQDEEEEDSMFADNFDVEASAKNTGLDGTTYRDQWDDKEGYYKMVPGELLDKRYKVAGSAGGGVFSGVVRATDTLAKPSESKVAIKIIRNNDLMYKASLKELEILRKLNSVDKDGTHYVVRLKRHFMHKNHLCMVFESAAMNLRELTKRFGRDGAEVVGLSMAATQRFAKQLLMSLKLLKKCHILHADIKPDNILVDENKSVVKLCDLGSASDIKENDIAKYIASRFYRAPEIMLGLPYDYGIDMWSLGCTLYELYTGKILFNGRNNNEMLKEQMELKGKPSKSFIKKGRFAGEHFDMDTNFTLHELDAVTKKPRIRIIKNQQPTAELMAMLKRGQRLDEKNMKKLQQFKDLLDKMLMIDPEKRISPKEALQHDFIRLNE